LRKNQNAAKYVDENSPVRGLFSPEELQDKFGLSLKEDGSGQANLDEVKDPNLKELLKQSSTKKKKKKKKTKITAAAAEMMFEGGSSSSGSLSEYEGGSGDEGAF
jgi:hypothetical protein